MSKRILLCIVFLMTMATIATSAAEDNAVPSDMIMVVRLETPLSTQSNQTGDKFSATILEPERYRDALVKGHIRRIEQSGKLSGRTEMSLAFDSIELPGETEQRFRAHVKEIKESENVKMVDNEGHLISGSRTDQTLVRSGIGATVGGVLGGVLGGGKGAALGILLGAGAGAGSVYAQGVREIRLDPGTELELQTE